MLPARVIATIVRGVFGVCTLTILRVIAPPIATVAWSRSPFMPERTGNGGSCISAEHVSPCTSIASPEMTMSVNCSHWSSGRCAMRRFPSEGAHPAGGTGAHPVPLLPLGFEPGSTCNPQLNFTEGNERNEDQDRCEVQSGFSTLTCEINVLIGGTISTLGFIILCFLRSLL